MIFANRRLWIAAGIGLSLLTAPTSVEAKKSHTAMAEETRIEAEQDSLLAVIRRKPGFEARIDEFAMMGEELESRGVEKTEFYSCAAGENARIDMRVYHAFKKAKKMRPDYELYRRNHGVEGLARMAKAFKQKNSQIIDGIADAFDVNPDYVAAIFAVESHCGNYMMEFNTFSSLLTQYLLLPERRRFAVEEMQNLFMLCKERGISPDSLPSSYAGAIGHAQFIPSSVRKYYVGSGSDNAKADLFCHEDAAYSIANYLKEHGWRGKHAFADTGKATADGNYVSVFKFNNSMCYVKMIDEIARALAAEQN